ncbi:hypothetical protein MTP16_25825 (plasmid) [Hymenobacter monticola]|uniref:Lipoprotein n=1 Tax=Hymenobacter monticola TaxID=1705399 RepID=A0ABY4BCK3_9BACT|nr:hypothetical protein [Hymenobacter monticola]UOE36852.1 hypothetical protein MTP16_25825 [Hymenobacter monticola]
MILSIAISGCFSKQGQSDEDTVSRAFTKRNAKDYVGEYCIDEVRMHVDAATDTVHSLFNHSRLLLRGDSTYEFIEYPVFRLRAPDDSRFKLERLAHYSGHWTIEKFGSAYDKDQGTRRDFWSCAFVPALGGKRQEPNEQLFADSYISQKSGLVKYIYLYYGDIDSGDYVLLKRIAPARQQ